MTVRSARDGRPAGIASFNRRTFLITVPLAASLLAAEQTRPQVGAPEPKVSKRASDVCARKVALLEAAAAGGVRAKSRSTRLTEEELNSYLAFELKTKYHVSLKSLTVRLQDDSLEGSAVLDFDKLAMTSTKVFTRLMARLLSGVHTLSVHGRLVTADGLGNLELKEAQFDGVGLPNALVEEIITAVGRKQKPPFDPMTPSRMPFGIQRVILHPGYIDVLQ